MTKSCLAVFVLILSAGMTHAEEDFDLDLDFGFKQKSTISDFPLAEIGAEELSDAAIGNALHAMNTQQVEATGKPAYAEQQEIDEKRQTDELETDNNIELNESIPAVQILPSIPSGAFNDSPFTVSGGNEIGAGYNSGVVYENNNTAFERP